MKTFSFLRFCDSELLALALGMAPFLLMGISAQANDIFDRNDAFEYVNLSKITHSPVWSDTAPTRNNEGFDVTSVFGSEAGTQEIGNGEFVFSEEPPPSMVDWIEFTTFHAVPLLGYKVHLRGDLGRMASKVTLYSDIDENGVFEKVDEFNPVYSTPSFVVSSNTQRDLASRVLSKRWRIEFARDPFVPNGQRIIEVDAIAQLNPSAPQVNIDSPNNGDVFPEGQPVAVAIQAFDEGVVKRVDLFRNQKLFGSRTNQYQFLLGALPLGTHQLVAVAVDDLGAESEHTVVIDIVPPTPSILLSTPRIGGGFLHFDIDAGTEAAPQIVFTSTDLLEWSPVKTNLYPGSRWTFSTPYNPGRSQYYKLSQELLR